MDAQERARVRTGPSFQGRLTLGATRMLLFNYMVARASGGSLIIRTEDTDQLRFRPDLVGPYFADLDWLGVDFDEGGPRGGAYGPYQQSARLSSYSRAARELVALGAAYNCFCSTSDLAAMRDGQRRAGEPVGYDGRCGRLAGRESERRLDQGEPAVVRLRFAGHSGDLTFTDLVYGESGDVAEPTDPVLLKSDGFPTYHLSSVVDDHAMEITHVIRANAWRSSTPKHVLIYQAFGWRLPAFAHLPILAERANLTVAALRESGVPAGAIVNFALTLGWAGPAESRIFDLPAAVRGFDLRQASRSAGQVDAGWLAELSRQHLRRQDQDRTVAELAPFLRAAGVSGTRPGYGASDPDYDKRVLAVIAGRAGSYADIAWRYGYFWDRPGRATRSCLPADPAVLRALGQLAAGTVAGAEDPAIGIADQPEPWPGSVFALIRRLQPGLPARSLGRALACAITGTDHAPALEATLKLLGRDEMLARLSEAITLARDDG